MYFDNIKNFLPQISKIMILIVTVLVFPRESWSLPPMESNTNKCTHSCPATGPILSEAVKHRHYDIIAKTWFLKMCLPQYRRDINPSLCCLTEPEASHYTACCILFFTIISVLCSACLLCGSGRLIVTWQGVTCKGNISALGNSRCIMSYCRYI